MPRTPSPPTSDFGSSIATGILILIFFGTIIAFLEKKRRKKKIPGYTPIFTSVPPESPTLVYVQKHISNQFLIDIEINEPSHWGTGNPKNYDIYASYSKNFSNAFKIHSFSYSPGIFVRRSVSPSSYSKITPTAKKLYIFVKAVSSTKESPASNPIQIISVQSSTTVIKSPKRNTGVGKRMAGKTKTPKQNNSQFMNWNNDTSNWPASTDFTDAIQNPKVCFNDPNFSKVIPVSSKIRQGLPLSFEGSFAIVFKVSDGNHFSAVKCFTSPPHGFENQEKLTSFFHKNKLDFVIDYNSSVEIQIQSGGKSGFYPTLTSAWVKGKTLLEFLEDSSQKNLLKSQAKIIAKNFREIVHKMELLDMAHGDLSGKNIMIESNMKIKLIDYDGIYIPEFKNQDVKESGTKHFQHQSRLDGKISLFDETMDRFSALVIYLSLLILSEKPNMWKTYHDESNLIFNQNDLNDPDNSKIFRELPTINNSEIQKLTNDLKQYCKNGLSKIPHLVT